MSGWNELASEGDGMEGVLARWVASNNSCVDPYWLLAEAMGFAAFANAALVPEYELPVLIENNHDGDERFVLRARTRAQLPQLIRMVESKKVRRFQLAAPRTAGINRTAFAAPPAAAAERDAESSSDTPCTMHLGVIDDGFPFAHSNLIRPDGRPLVSSIWDQMEGAALRKGWKKDHCGFGGLLTRGAIERAMRKCRGPGGVDEAGVYAETQYRVNQPGVPHGCGVTHMLAGKNIGLPDGSRNDLPVPSDDLHCVQLPADGTLQDTAGGWLGYYALAGVRHIIHRIQQVEKGPWHAIINLSYGSIAGPHDGTSMFEEAIDAVCTRYDKVQTGKVDIVVAAGNTRGKKIHAQRTIEAGGTGVFRFFTPPDNPRESYLELWLPDAADDQSPISPVAIGITVTAPTGDRVSVQAGQAHLMRLSPCDAPCAGIVFSRRVAQGRNGTMVLLLVRPTQTAGRDGRAPAGVWKAEVCSEAERPVTIHGWVERNDMVVFNRRNQQARFVEDPDDARHVNDDLTLSSVANGRKPIVVGAVRQSDGVMTDYSGIDSRDGVGKPHYFAASDASPAMPGVLVPGFYSGTTARMSGTSIAAPWVARWRAQPDVEAKPAPQKTGAAPVPKQPGDEYESA